MLGASTDVHVASSSPAPAAQATLPSGSPSRRGFLVRRELVVQVIRQTPHGGDVGRGDAYPCYGLDVGAQLEVAQRVKAILGKRMVRIDVAAQNQTDLLGKQTPQPGGPLVEGQLVQLGA